MPPGLTAYPPHPMRPFPPLIINAALTGMVSRREQVPHLPVTPEQIVEDAVACAEAGAAIVHLHARDPSGRPTWRHEIYEEFIPAIRERAPNVVICVTTSGRAFPELEKRADVLRLDGSAKPDMASLTLGSLNFRTGPSVNSVATIEELARRMLDAGIKPELEIFDLGMAYLLERLLDRGLVEEPIYANLLFGSLNTAPARAEALVDVKRALPEGAIWATAGLGGFQLPMNAIAVFMGGHVRTGLEDNPYLEHVERTPATNALLVERVRAIAEIAGRELATPAFTRKLLALKPSAAAVPASGRRG